MIRIRQVKQWREELDATHLVVFAIDRKGTQHVATHGESETDAKEAATAGNNLKRSLGWPENLCKSLPLERRCKNCTFYKPDYGIRCFNGWSGDGSSGRCMFDIPPHPPTVADNKCSHFEPNQ